MPYVGSHDQEINRIDKAVKVIPHGTDNVDKSAVEQIFISHSSRDHEEIKFITGLFKDSNVKPVFMEFEQWTRNEKPNWLWIREEIQKSKAVFLIITKNMAKNKYTENWVSFEVGVAAAHDPPIPVYVFREAFVKFPVPYLTWYFDEPLTNLDHVKPEDFSMMLFEFIRLTIHYQVAIRIIGEAIWFNKDEISDRYDDLVHNCPECCVEFRYFGWNEKINCPCCSNELASRLGEDVPIKDAAEAGAGHK